MAFKNTAAHAGLSEVVHSKVTTSFDIISNDSDAGLPASVNHAAHAGSFRVDQYVLANSFIISSHISEACSTVLPASEHINAAHAGSFEVAQQMLASSIPEASNMALPASANNAAHAGFYGFDQWVNPSAFSCETFLG